MRNQKDGEFSTNCLFNCVSVAPQHLYKRLPLSCCRLHSALKYPPFLVKDSIIYMSTLQKKAPRPIHGTWSVFPSVHAANATELNKKLFSLEQSQETGMDRLKMMFRTTEFGHLSPELNIVVNTMGLSTFIGAFIGGTLASRTAVEKLVRKYQAAVFNHQFEAKRMFQDQITLTLAGTAFKWAWRLALFSGIYTSIVVTTTVYNNKSSILDHIAAGAISGSMWKLKMGIPATAVGAGLGGVLGLFGGCLSACVLWLSGTSVEELRYWHHDYWEREYRKQAKMMKAKEPDKVVELLAIEHDESLQQQNTLEKTVSS